jgi:serine protease Do
MNGTEGALVTEPQAGSPAAKAGVFSGDVITAINSTAVKDTRDLAQRASQLGSSIPIMMSRISLSATPTSSALRTLTKV